MIVAAIVCILSGTILQCIGAWQDSQTTDEAVHLAAGLSYWQTGDYRLNPEHPPLIKLLAARPVRWLTAASLPFDQISWRTPDQWTFGAQVLYSSYPTLAGARTIMMIARIPMILIWLVLALCLWWLAYHRWGPTAGLLTTVFFVFDPNFLGHGHLVTTDVAVSLFFLLTIWIADRFFTRPAWSTLGWLILVFAAAQISKFSATILWVIIPLLGLIRWADRDNIWSWRWWWRMMAGLVIGTALVTWLVYGCEIITPQTPAPIDRLWTDRQGIIAQTSRQNPPNLIQRLAQQTSPDQPLGRIVNLTLRGPVPAFSYWRGLMQTFSHNYFGHTAFLLGQTATHGWWYYFPLAIFFKLPAVTFSLLIIALLLPLWQMYKPRIYPWSTMFRPSFRWWLWTLPPIFFLGWSLTSHINIGVRHIFPVLPFLYLLIGRLATVPRPQWQRWWLGGLVSAGGLLILTTGLAWPNTISYYSEFIGGWRQGHRYLLDSNLDWNQDIWRLRKFLDQQNFSEVHLVLFGSIPIDKIFPETQPVLEDWQIQAGQLPTGIVIISAGQLYNVDGSLHWYRAQPPAWRIGGSIYVYDFRS